MPRSRKIFYFFAALIVIVAIVAFFVFQNFSNQIPSLNKLANEIAKINQAAENINPKISAPEPLRNRIQAPDSFLTYNGVIAWTNNQRRNNDLGSLKSNEVLNAAAQEKVDDMFANQYFAHVSPEGYGPDYWPKQAGYQYIAVGENLALGNFADDQALVQAWMDSPGHRENILDTSFEEIGVAVKQGEFEGEQTWLAVQVFGRPKSACPTIDQNLKTQTQTNQTQLEAWQIQIQTYQQRLIDERPKGKNISQEAAQAYNALVNEYNALVEKYNALVQTTKALVDQYNVQAQTFNKCANQ